MSQNIEESTEESEIDIPLFCYHAKFFLVEELALVEKFNQLHYGRCCIIGKIATDSIDPNRLCIENIRLPSLPKEYALPEGTIRLYIITNNLRQHIPRGKICEIVGEVVLYDKIDCFANRVPLTGKDIADKLKYLHLNNESKSDYYKSLQKKYKPAVVVDYIRPVKRGFELIERNLEIRMLSN